MSKNLKDIFETGRKRLTDLAEKRKELVSRCAELKNGAGTQGLNEASRRLLSLEDSTLAEITAQLDAAQEIHQQSLAQIREDNERHISNIKEELEFRVSRLAKELSCLQQWYLDLSTDKSDQHLRPLEQKYRSIVAQYGTAVAGHLNDLDTASRKVHAILAEEKERIAGEVTGNIKEAKDKLSHVVEDVTRQLQTQSEQLEEDLHAAHAKQVESLANICQHIDADLAAIREHKTEEIDSLTKEVEGDLLNTCQKIVSETTTRMNELSLECSSELETSYQFNHRELSATLSQLRGQTNESIEQLKQLLDQAEQRAKQQAAEIGQKSKRSFDDALQARSLELSSDTARAMLEEMTADLQKMSAQLSKQLNNSTHLHRERFSTLLNSSEKTLTVSLDSLKFDLDRMVEMQRVAFREKENLLSSRLDTLERQYNRIMAGISDDI